MKKKRITALLTTIMLVCSVLSACGNAAGTTSPEKDISAEETTGTTETGDQSKGADIRKEGEEAFAETIESAEKLTKPDGSQIRVGMNMGDLTNQTFAEFSTRCQELAKAQDVLFTYASYGTDPGQQISIIENWIEGGYDAIILQNNTDQSVLEGVLQKAKDEGILILSYDMALDIADYNLLADNYELGKIIGGMTGNWVKENYGDEPVKVMAVTARQVEFVIPRCDGIIDALHETVPNAEVIEVNWTGETGGNSEDFGELILTAHPDCVALCAITDPFVLGAYEVLKGSGKYEKGDFGIFGCDATYDSLEAISNDDIFIGTVFADTVGLVVKMYSTAVDIIAHGEPAEDIPQTQYFPMTPIYIDNLEDARH